MTGQRRTHEKAGLSFLPIFHAAAFLLLSAVAIVLGADDAQQLRYAVSNPYHFGAPHRSLPIIGAVLGIACAVPTLWFFVKRRPVPLVVSGLAIAGVLCGYFGLRNEEPRRSFHAANLDVLAAAQQLHRLQIDELQKSAEIAADPAAWRAALESLRLPNSPVRTKSFEQLPFEVSMLSDQAASLSGLRPGTLAVWVSADQVEFTIAAIGFAASGEAAPLKDKEGRTLILTGAFNPNAKASSTPDVKVEVRLPWEQPGR